MNLLRPLAPPYDPLTWQDLPLIERGQQVCACWALHGYGAPALVLLFYALKVALYIAGWSFFCSFSPGLGGLAALPSWWLAPVAFQKAILWSALFEVLGLGCGSGPLTGRYLPPFGGALYFLRPGTTKLPLFPGLPLFGGTRRTLLDVLLYLGLLAVLLRALVAPAPGPLELWPIVALVPVLALTDKTTFLALRGEHYFTAIVVFLFASNLIATSKIIQLALWFFAGVSKLNAHFPTVICVMTSNSPVLRPAWLRRRMYRAYPDDLRPSRLATTMAHLGAALEFSVPLTLGLVSHPGPLLITGLCLMLLLHSYITSNVPMGVPIEWNILVVYAGFALFYAHPTATVLHAGPPWLVAAVLLAVVAVPLLGNLFPRRISFLPAMRYYAGNWACSVWLFKRGSEQKLARLTKTSPWIYDQLAPFYDHATAVGVVGKVMAFRLMHLHGRALPELLPRAVPHLREYHWLDGELVAGLVLGWNFGDGHLHDERLLQAIQDQCGFEDGELRCVFLEAQPLGQDTLEWRIADARTGVRERGHVTIADLLRRQPWQAQCP